MNDFSDDPELNNKQQINLTEYTKQDLDIHHLNYYHKIHTYNHKNSKYNCVVEKYHEENEIFGEKNLTKISKEKFDRSNELKRKHISEKTLVCEYCKRESNKYIRSKINGESLCKACYGFEYRHGYLVPLDERQKRESHKGHTVCEFCQKESNKFAKGNISGKVLCLTCYVYERLYNRVLPLDERKENGKHKDHILVCEFCQTESTEYRKGTFTEKSLCRSCYNNERQYGYLIPLDERKKREKHKNNILVCQICQEESPRYTKGKVSGKALCASCYNYEDYHGYLVPLIGGQKIIRKYTKNDRTNRFMDADKIRYKDKTEIKETKQFHEKTK
jgi:formylmethanofuran dehydrogenase subunit E